MYEEIDYLYNLYINWIRHSCEEVKHVKDERNEINRRVVPKQNINIWIR